MPGSLDAQTQQNIMEGVDFDPIQKLLQENMPVLIPGQLGRTRLIDSLSNRFGPNFRAQQGPRSALTHFDEQTKLVEEVLRARGFADGE